VPRDCGWGGGYSDSGMPDSEKALIRRIRQIASGGPAIVTGIGDDAAVLRVPAGHDVLITTDFSIENIHFRREWHPPEIVGWRCLTRGLSDIAAMGGDPQAAFLSLALPRDLPQPWVDRFLRGLLQLAGKYDVPLAGGDTAQSLGGIQADIVVLGSVPKGKAVLRSGAKPGELVYVTGELGGSAAALARMKKTRVGGAENSRDFRREPRVRIGQWVRKKRIPSAMIDISDGLSTDLEHICQESRVGVDIELEVIPRARTGRRRQRFVDLEYALHGGDDYELLFTSSRSVPSIVGGVPVTRIGRTTTSRSMRLVDAEGHKKRFEAQGWEHFRGRAFR